MFFLCLKDLCAPFDQETRLTRRKYRSIVVQNSEFNLQFLRNVYVSLNFRGCRTHPEFILLCVKSACISIVFVLLASLAQLGLRQCGPPSGKRRNPHEISLATSSPTTSLWWDDAAMPDKLQLKKDSPWDPKQSGKSLEQVSESLEKTVSTYITIV